MVKWKWDEVMGINMNKGHRSVLKNTKTRIINGINDSSKVRSGE